MKTHNALVPVGPLLFVMAFAATIFAPFDIVVLSVEDPLLRFLTFLKLKRFMDEFCDMLFEVEAEEVFIFGGAESLFIL